MNRQFPPEIVQLIVTASLDPYDIFTASKNLTESRYATLRTYSLLNSTWYGASQPKLVRSVRFLAGGSRVNFREMAQRRGGTVEGVRDLCGWADNDRDASALRTLLKSTPHLLNLYCYSGTMNSGDLAPLHMLRRLQFISVNIAGSPSSSLLCLPDLQRLDMFDVSLEDSASHFLTPACLPQLRRIDTDDFGSIAPLVPQLEIISFDSDYVDYTLLSRAKSLLLLPLSRHSRDRLAIFSNLPSLPPFLHIDFASYAYIDVDHEVRLALEELLKAKNPGLRMILLNDHGIDDNVKSLIQRLQERGIRVQLMDKGLDLDGAIEEMYRIRAREERPAEDGVGRIV